MISPLTVADQFAAKGEKGEGPVDLARLLVLAVVDHDVAGAHGAAVAASPTPGVLVAAVVPSRRHAPRSATPARRRSRPIAPRQNEGGP